MVRDENIYVRRGQESDIEIIFELIEEQAIHHQVDPNTIDNSP